MDDHGDQDSDGDGPPVVSRLDRRGARPYRAVSRANPRFRGRDRFRRKGKQLPIAELLGLLIKHYGLTDEARRRFVCLYWREIVGERIASRTTPDSFTDSVLHVSAVNSSWVQELQFGKAALIARINTWVDDNRAWLGPPPLVTDIRFALGTKRRDRLVDPEHAEQLRQRHLRRLYRAPDRVPPGTSQLEREAIETEASQITDGDLRAIVEHVRIKWNR